MRLFEDFFICFVAAIIIFAVSMVPINALAWYSCSSKADYYEMEYKYGFFEGCFVNHKGRWVELDKLRATDL